jgi:ATP-binding cassette, subfamily B, bacterial
VLLSLRRRVFAHFQRLDVAFHDRYTSGRVTSRLTSDIDAITELLAGGFDGLVTAVLTMVGVGVLMLSLDVELGLVCLLCFLLLVLLVRWFARTSAVVYRKVREASALVIVQFVLPPRAAGTSPPRPEDRRRRDRRARRHHRGRQNDDRQADGPVL